MRIAIILAIILNSATVFGQFAEFSFEGKPVAKLDKVKAGDTIYHIFPFTNSGDVPLIFSSYEVSCTCTKAFYPSEPIMPGETNEVRVTFDSTGKMGWQYRTITLVDNTKKGRTELELRLKVVN